MKTLKILEGWTRRSMTMTMVPLNPRLKKLAGQQVAIQVTVFISPKKRYYRLAASWERPDLLITTGVWEPEQDIRLCKITDPRWKKLIRQKVWTS